MGDTDLTATAEAGLGILVTLQEFRRWENRCAVKDVGVTVYGCVSMLLDDRMLHSGKSESDIECGRLNEIKASECSQSLVEDPLTGRRTWSPS
jgi:hypothetical protein